MNGNELRRQYTLRFAPGVVCVEGQRIDLGGVNPWEYEWSQLDPVPLKLSHPSHPHQLHNMSLYRVDAGHCTVVFAAAELSPNVWGFYEKLD